MSDWDELLASDRERVWHPYAPMPAALASLPVVSAQRRSSASWPTDGS